MNIERIKELQPWFHGDYVVILRDDRQLMMSASYREKLDELRGPDGRSGLTRATSAPELPFVLPGRGEGECRREAAWTTSPGRPSGISGSG